MTAPAVIRRECTAKDRWSAERGALRALGTARRAGRDPDRLLHVYACPHGCGGWHMGHRPGLGRRPGNDADGLSAAMVELLWEVSPRMRRSSYAPGAGWHLGQLHQGPDGRWQAMLQGPTRSRQVWSNRNCPTAAAAVRDLCSKARGSRWWDGR